MQHSYQESPAESSRSAETRLQTQPNDHPDISFQVLGELTPEPTYSGKGKGKAPSTAVTQRSIRSTLLCLPAEIRNRIYELVFWQSDGIHIDGAQDMVEPPENFLAITEVCRQIHAETRLLVYSVNTFFVDFHFVFWLRSLEDDQRKAISSIELPFTHFMRLNSGRWSSEAPWQNEGYVSHVMMVLPGLRHVNLAIRIETGDPVGGIVPGQDDVQQYLEPFRRSFEQSTTGVRVTSTITFVDPFTQSPHDGP